MAYEFDDRRYYPSKASGKWTNEQAMPGDFRTARMRQYLEDVQAGDTAQTSERARASQMAEQLQQILSAQIPSAQPVDLSILGFLKSLKDKYSGLELADIPRAWFASGGLPTDLQSPNTFGGGWPL